MSLPDADRGRRPVRVFVVDVCTTRNGTSSPVLVMVVVDASELGPIWYPCGSIKLQPKPLAACSGVLETKSDRTQPAWLPSLTWYQTLPAASGAR